ncbi:MAG: hypothetical protein F6J86_02660 [Symploca sp. SIO1B1]|nr:hypothetical protein [Symploca sp. SIO1B1]
MIHYQCQPITCALNRRVIFIVNISTVGKGAGRVLSRIFGLKWAKLSLLGKGAGRVLSRIFGLKWAKLSLNPPLQVCRIYFPFPIPNSQFPIPNSQFPIPNSQFPIPKRSQRDFSVWDELS